ncbi:DUF1173 family protein [Burkholderia pseudomallei]|uniref:DUF1173 family protein n=1 Tax=Burkholderia pseudomallei TaxID=28450 RepID=UPI00128EB0DE
MRVLLHLGARCLCREGDVEMGVATRGQEYAIRAVRRTRAQHAFDCEFSEPPL